MAQPSKSKTIPAKDQAKSPSKPEESCVSGVGVAQAVSTSVIEEESSAEDNLPEMRAMREAFNAFDMDRDGFITAAELMEVMLSLRQKVTPADIKKMIRHVDIDGKGKVAFEEFVSFMLTRNRRQSVTDDEMLEAFRVFDTDGDGYITGEDIRKTMGQLGEELSEADVRDMITEADLDKDGRINLSEFVILMQHRFINSGQVIDSNGAFTPEQKGELRIIFSLFDKDHDNNISMDEVMQVMQAMGQQPDIDRLRETFQLVDLDGNGLIDFNEFVQMVEVRVGRQSEDAEMRALFAAFDKDSNGYIDARELKQTMAEIGMPVTAADVKEMLREAGVTSKRGRIYYEDFLKMMTGQIGEKQRSMATLGSSDADSASLSDEVKGTRPENMPDVKVAFAMFDKDGDGVITCAEVLQVMVSLGIDVDSDEVKEIVRKIDLDGNGVIEFGEFASWMELHKSLTHHPRECGPDEEEMMQLFRVFDKDSDGSINAKDLSDTMKDLGLVLTGDDTAAMMREAGLGPDGNIHYKEFCQMMCPLLGDIPGPQTGSAPEATDDSELRVMFTEFDQDRDGLVGIDEVRRITQALGQSTSEAILKNHFNKLDDNGNGLINYPEFLQLLQEVSKKNLSHSPAPGRHQPKANPPRREKKDIPVGPFYPSGKEEAKEEGEEEGKDEEERTEEVRTNGTATECLPPAEPEVPVEPVQVNGITTASLHAAPIMKVSSDDDQLTKELKTAFLRFSQTTEGVLTTAELRDLLQSLSYDTRSPSLREMLEQVDKEGGGHMTMEEFLKAMPSQHRTRSVRHKHGSGQRSRHRSGGDTGSEPEAWRAFKVFDKDHNGYISMSELRQTMKEMGIELSNEEVELMMHRADTNGDGKIDYKEFIRMVQSNRLVKQVAIRQQTSALSATSQVNGGMSRTSSRKSDKVCAERTTQLSTSPPTDAGRICKAFERFDPKGTGCISMTDAVTALKSLGVTCDLTDLEQQHPTGNFKIDFKEFLQMMKKYQHQFAAPTRRRTQDHEMRAAFKVFDINRDGLIDQRELLTTMKCLGEEVSNEDVQTMIRAADKNNDGKIDYEEFISMMYNQPLKHRESFFLK